MCLPPAGLLGTSALSLSRARPGACASSLLSALGQGQRAEPAKAEAVSSHHPVASPSSSWDSVAYPEAWEGLPAGRAAGAVGDQASNGPSVSPRAAASLQSDEGRLPVDCALSC